MSDHQLIQELRSTLDEAAEDLWLPADAAARARSRGRRRRTGRGLLAVIPAAGLLAGILIVHGGGPGASPPRAGVPGRPDTQTVAYVTSHAEAALGTVSHYIVKTTIRQAPVIDSWYDPVSRASRTVVRIGHDTTIDWSQPTGAGTGFRRRFTYVDLGARTWSRGAVAGTAAQRSAAVAAQRRSALYPSPLTNPAQFRRELQGGAVTIAGRGPVNGRPAIELRLTRGQTDLVYWVDARTYRPLRIALAGGGSALDIIWLPRTPGLVNQTNHPQIPPGFSRTPLSSGS